MSMVGGQQYKRVGRWTFTSLVYGREPEYFRKAGDTGDQYDGYATMGTSRWRTEGNPLNLSWLSWGIITLGVLLSIVAISLGIAAAAGAFNDTSNSTAVAASPPPPAPLVAAFG